MENKQQQEFFLSTVENGEKVQDIVESFGIFNQSSAAHILCDEQGKILSCNKAMLQLLGYENVGSWNLSDLIPALTIQQLNEPSEALIDRELEIIGSSGIAYMASVSVSKTSTKNGERVYNLAVINKQDHYMLQKKKE